MLRGVAVEGDFSYQWQRSLDGGDSWADIVGATGESYVLTRADVARWVRLVVRLTDVDGVETVYSTTAGRIVPNIVAPVDTGPVVVLRDSRVRSEEVPSVSNLVDVPEVGPDRFDDLARLPGQVRGRRPALPEVVDESASAPRPGPEGRPALPEVVDESASAPRPGPEGRPALPEVVDESASAPRPGSEGRPALPEVVDESASAPRPGSEGRPALPEVVDESAGTVRVVGRWGVDADAGSDDGKFRLNLSEVVAAVKQQVEVGYPEATAEVEEMPAEIAIAGLLVEGVFVSPLALPFGVEVDAGSKELLVSDVKQLEGSGFQLRLSDGRVLIIRLTVSDAAAGEVNVVVEEVPEGAEDEQTSSDDEGPEDSEEGDQVMDTDA